MKPSVAARWWTLGGKRYFISYVREDLATANAVADALRAAGVSVDIDTSALRPGDDFSKRLTELIRSCDGCVVIWSKRSVDSEWVRGEVALARQAGKRVFPIRIDDCVLPLPYNIQHALDFTAPGAMERLLAAVAGSEASAPEKFEPPPPPAQQSPGESTEPAEEIARAVADQTAEADAKSGQTTSVLANASEQVDRHHTSRRWLGIGSAIGVAVLLLIGGIGLVSLEGRHVDPRPDVSPYDAGARSMEELRWSTPPASQPAEAPAEEPCQVTLMRGETLYVQQEFEAAAGVVNQALASCRTSRPILARLHLLKGILALDALDEMAARDAFAAALALDGATKLPDFAPVRTRQLFDDVRADRALAIVVMVRSVPRAEIKLLRNNKVCASGRSPMTARLPPGTYDIEVSEEREGLLKMDQIVLEAGSRSVEHTVTVGKSTLLLNSIPWTAVTLDGKSLGVTPLRSEVYEGIHTVLFDCSNGKRDEQELAPKAGEEVKVKARCQ